MWIWVVISVVLIRVNVTNSNYSSGCYHLSVVYYVSDPVLSALFASHLIFTKSM